MAAASVDGRFGVWGGGGGGGGINTPSGVEEGGYYGQAVKRKGIEPGIICCY
jgi:hypothetical protein